MSNFIKDLLGIKSKKKVKKSFSLDLKISRDLIKSNDGYYKILLKVIPINGELLSQSGLELVSSAIQGALSSFEGRIGIYIQSESVNIDKNIENIEKFKEEVNSENKLVLLEEQKKFLESMAIKSRNVLNFYSVLEVREDNYDSAREILNDGYLSFKSELESQGMYVDQMEGKDIRNILYKRMNPESSQVEFLREDWDIDNILPENGKIYKDGRHVEIENRIYRFFSIVKYPKSVDKYRWLRKVFDVKGDINIAIILTPKNKATIMKELSKAVNELGAKAIDTRKEESLRQKYQDESDSAREIINELGNDNISLYDTNITIGISALNIKDLNTLSNILRSKISSTYCQATELKYKGYEPFITTLPILANNKITKNYVWNLTTKDIASIIPFDSSELMESKGVLIGENVVSNGLVIIDTYNKIYNNPHECILADSGSGKSFRIKTDAMRHIPYRDNIIMFDLENEFNFPWGKNYRFSATSGIISNPFHIRNSIIDSDNEADRDNVGTYLATKVMDIMIFFKWILKDLLDPYAEALLEEDVRDSYKKVGLTFESSKLPDNFPTLNTLQEVLMEKIKDKSIPNKSKEVRENILASLQPYISGAYSYMFNGQTNWDYDFLTVFNISGLPEAVMKPLYDILLKDTWQFCKTNRLSTKRVYVDEAHQFADPKNPQTLKFLATVVKRGRKYGVSFVTATQNLPDFLSIERYGQAIIDNSYFKLFMRLGETDIPEVRRLYGLSDKETSILRGSSSKREGAKGRGIFIAGNQRVLIQVRASKYELKIVDPIQYNEIYGDN